MATPEPDGLQLQDNKLEPHAMNLTLSDRGDIYTKTAVV